MKIYIAGPYTKGDVVLNVRRAIHAGDALFDAGHTPFIPHLCHLWHTVAPRPYDDWIRYTLRWLRTCHAVLRLPGESAGADQEVAFAQQLGLPIYTTLEDLILAHKGDRDTD